MSGAEYLSRSFECFHGGLSQVPTPHSVSFPSDSICRASPSQTQGILPSISMPGGKPRKYYNSEEAHMGILAVKKEVLRKVRAC